MAKEPNKAGVSPDKIYRVVLTGSIQVGRRMVHPGPNVKLSGDVLAGILETNGGAVASHEVVED